MSSRLEELLKRVNNPILLLQRYLAYPKKGGNGNQDATWDWELDRRNYKNEAWKKVESAVGEAYKRGPIGEWLTKLQSRGKFLEEALTHRCYKVRTFKGKVAWRLIVGLGLPSPLETGITLHHLYGFPYLPGSAIKGVTRSYRLQEIADELGVPRLSAQHISAWKNDKRPGFTPWELLEHLLMSPVPDDSDNEERKRKLLKQIEQRWNDLKDALEKSELREWQYLSNVLRLPDKDELIQEYIRDFSRAFGSTEAKGEVMFLDAYPKSLTAGGEPVLELDVMNPHYGDYYMGKKDARRDPIPPADWLSPVPVFFLTVRQGTIFQFRLAGRDSDLLGKVEGWVRDALRELGIGAKTRAGYGELAVAEADGDELTSEAEAEEQAGSRTAEVPQPEAHLAARIERWTPREMSIIEQLIEQLSSLPDPESRCALARRLQQKLREGKKWGKKYRDKGWYRVLEEILGSEACQENESGDEVKQGEDQ